MSHTLQIIPDSESGTLATIFQHRVDASPNEVAYTQHEGNQIGWRDYSWQTIADKVAKVQVALHKENISAGDKIAIMMRNSCEWIVYDQAAQGLGIIVVPVYTNDRPDNVAYILEDAEVKLLVLENNKQLNALMEIEENLSRLVRIVLIKPSKSEYKLSNIVALDDWISKAPADLQTLPVDKDTLATIVYTSGTTGKPKGVMLSHRNILSNVYSALDVVDVYSDDTFLSFLPLSHMLERMAGYYLPVICGSRVAFSRSIPQLASDLLEIKPTVMVSVPRIFERVYGKIQDKLLSESALKQKLFYKAVDAGWLKFQCEQKKRGWHPALLIQPLLDKLVGAKVRDKLGGRMRLTVCGGAALSDKIAQFFIGLGIPILQGYGLTETSPVLSVNTPEKNDPASVGIILPKVQVRIGENDEIQAKGDNIMLGYWHNEQATREIFSDDGWLRTGDKGKIENDHLFITGRIKEIIVLANGEKIPPSDLELAITLDQLIEQTMIIGEGRPYLSALVVLNEDALKQYCEERGIVFEGWNYAADKELYKAVSHRIKSALHEFPGYAKVRRVCICSEPWSVENGLLTPTLKTKRNKIEVSYKQEIDDMYEGH